MSERELADALARLAGPVVPGEDPYGRLMRRHRRSRRTLAAGWSTAVVAVVVAALFGPIGIHGAATPVLGGPSGSGSAEVPDPGTVLTPWTRRLIDSPVRGGLAGDTAFLTELTALIQQRDVRSLPDGQVKILFADDLEELRVVVAVRADGQRQQGIMLTAGRGASPQELNSADDRIETPDEPAAYRFVLRPFFNITVGRTRIGVAPAGCRITSADVRADHVTWFEEPGGDYARTDKSWTWQRVTCDGEIRFQGPTGSGMGLEMGRPVSEEQLTAGLSGARGQVDTALAREHLAGLSTAETTGPPRLLFMGRPPGTEIPVTYSLIIAPQRDGWWEVDCRADPNLGGSSMVTSVDLSRPDTVFGWTLDIPNPADSSAAPTPDAQNRWPVLLVAPPTAAKVQIRDEAGKLLDTVSLTQGIGTTYQKPDAPLHLRALNAAGTPIADGTYPLPTEQIGIPFIETWD